MLSQRQHPLYHLSPEDTLIAIYIWVDDEVKAMIAEGLRLPQQPAQKASYSELICIAMMITLLGMDYYKGFVMVSHSYRHLFPHLPHFTRFYRILRNLHQVNAHLALRLVNGSKEGLKVVDLKAIGLAHGARLKNHRMAEAEIGKGPLGGFSGFKLAAVMDENGVFASWALLAGNSHENEASDLVKPYPNCLGDTGFRWVETVLTPPYKLKGGKIVQTAWQDWMFGIRNFIETRFSVLVRTLGIDRLESKDYWSFVSRVNLIIWAANLLQSRSLLKIAGIC
jgi:hypothetical protein